MGFGGTRKFKIINECNTDITAVRITHFLEGTDYNHHSTLFIRDIMSPGAEAEQEFTSYSGKKDNWTVSFQTNEGCFTCGKLTESMGKDLYDYKLIISRDKFKFQYMEGSKSHEGTSTVKSVYNQLT